MKVIEPVLHVQLTLSTKVMTFICTSLIVAKNVLSNTSKEEKKDGKQDGAHQRRNEMSRITKNKKRIDPRYFLHETTHRDQLDEGFMPARHMTDKGKTTEFYYKEMVKYLGIDKFAMDQAGSSLPIYQIDGGGEAAAEIKKKIPLFMHEFLIKPLVGKYMTADGIDKLKKLYPTGDDYYNFGYSSSVGTVEDILEEQYRELDRDFQAKRKGRLTDERNMHIGDLYLNVAFAQQAGYRLMKSIGSFAGMGANDRKLSGKNLRGEQ